MKPKSKEKLGKLLIEHNYINQKQIDKALQKQKNTQHRLGELLIELDYISEEELIEILEIQLGFKRIKLSNYKLDSSLAKYVPQNISETYQVVPVFYQDNKLEVAMTDPSNIIALDAISIAADCEVVPYITSSKEIEDVQKLIYSKENNEPFQGVDNIENNNITYENNEQSVKQIVKKLMKEAITRRASDIHIEPNEKDIRVRFRINGVLQERMTLPVDILNTLTSRIKVLAGMDITKKRIPQSGRIDIKQNNININTRVSTLPTLHGEKIVIRLLLKDNNLLDINKLGFNKKDVKIFKSLISKPHGIILVTGPTSSGKTTTLFAVLNQINNQNKYIVTIEDPIEYQLEGIYQVQTRSNPNLNYARALRSVLRQDPDVIMVGEIRDKETAEIAVRAAITGHLVLATMHTNDACSAIVRLLGLGIPPYLVYSTLLGVIAQRLVRTLCTCKKEYIPAVEDKKYLQMDEKESIQLYEANGCMKCDNTGYLNRTAVEELLVLDEDYEELIINKSSKQKIERLATEKGMIKLKESAKNRILEGLTTISEVKRVIK